MTSIGPLDVVTIEWDFALDVGCLPLRHHSISRDGVVIATVGPEENSFTDDISSGIPMGTVLIYTISANNVAGDGEESVELDIAVGQEPAAPSNIVVSLRFSETSVELQWDADVLITDNLATDSFLVYLDDRSGNTVVPFPATSP
jgi:hypothetical protein